MKKLRITSVGTILCIALVLIFLGLIGKFLIFSYYFKEKIREDVGFTVFFKQEETKTNIGIDKLMTILQKRPEVKSMSFVSKEKALEQFVAQGNENPMEVLDFNPLPSSLHIYLVDSFVEREQLVNFTSFIKQYKIVDDVKYAEDFVELINQNIKRITFAMTGVIVLLLIVSFVLIDNTIRLSMLSDRFVIKTMQYAGASNFFIALPYLKKSFIYGIIGGGLAGFLIWMMNKYIGLFFREFAYGMGSKWDIVLYVFLIIIGAIFSFLSTRSSVYKYLRIATTKLY